MSPSRRFTRFASALALVLSAANGVAQTSDCAVPQGNTRSILPQNSANLIGLYTSQEAGYVYGMTQFGFVRAPLADPMNPRPLMLGQHGQKFQNGGVVPMICDCWQMGTTMAFAEAPDGSARVFFDNNASGQGGGLPAQVGRVDGAGAPGFGQQIDLPAYTSGTGIGAIYLPSGRFIGYIPGQTSVHIVDATTTTGDPSPGAALRPFASLAWSGFVRLKAARIQIPSLAYDKYLLVGGLSIARQIRVAEIDPSSGIATERATAATVGEANTLDIAVVNNRIFVFSAEGDRGLQIYEYTPSQFGGSLARVNSIAGDINPAVVRGGQFPAIFLHRQASAFQSFIDVYDTKFLTQGGAARKAYSLPHSGAPQEGGISPGFLGRTMDAKVVTAGPVVTAYVYRVVQKRTGENEDSVRADKLDISCISADLTTPPVASASLVNLSAQGRTGQEQTRNYFGDRWHIRDTSASGAPLEQIEWDFNIVSGQFAANESGSLPGALSEVNPAYFPCDPSNNGNIRTGANCHVSLGSPSGGTYSIGNRTRNANGWSANTFISTGQSVLAPSASVAGFDGTVLRVLSGGQANASGSQGNTADAQFDWAFSPGSVAASGPIVNVPPSATGFILDVTYRGGYRSRVFGNVQQVDLVPDFTLAPNPVLNAGTLTLTNTMQVSGGTTLSNVTYVITPGGLSGTVPASFRTVNGSGAVTAPGTTGAYTITLTYTFSGAQGANQTLNVAKNFSTTSFAPQPVVGIYSDQQRTQPVFCQAGGCFVDTGRNYYFFDEEVIPGGVTHPGTAWAYVTTSGELPMGTTPAGNPGPVTYTFQSACSAGCSVKLTVGGVSRTVSITVSNPGPPPPPPPPPPTPPPGGFSVALSGPSSGSAGAPVNFTATASGGTGAITYAWRWGDNALSLNYIAGPATNSYTYPTPGQFTVSVRATDSAGIQAEGSAGISIGPPAGPPLTLSVLGPARGRRGQAVLFTTAVTGGVPPYGYAWRWGDNALGGYIAGPANHSHAYPELGSFTLSVRVTDNVGQSATATHAITIDAAFQALIVPGAAFLKIGDEASGDIWGTDVSVANPGPEPLSLAVAFVPYLTESAGSVDLSTLNYRELPTPLAPNGGSWSQTNVVEWLHGRQDKGTLVFRYEGPVPVVNGRVYFAKQSNPLGPAYGAPVEGFKADQSGRIVSLTAQGVDSPGDQTLIGLRSSDLYRFGITLYNSSGVETRAELRAFDETGAPIEILKEDGTRAAVREVRILPYQQAYLRNQDLGLPQDRNRRYVFKASKVGSEGSLVAFGAAIDTKTSDLEQFIDDTPSAVGDEQGSVYLYIPGASRFDSGSGAKWRTELRAYNPANVERTLRVEYLYTGAGEPESVASATVRIAPGTLAAADDVIGDIMDGFTPHDLRALSTTGLLRISYSPEVPGAAMVLSARNYDDQVTGTAGTQLAVYSRSDGVSASERPLFVPGAQEDSGEHVRLRTTLGVFAMDNRQTRVRVSVVKADGTVPQGGTFDFTLNQPGASSHMAQIFMDRNNLPGIVNNEAMTIKTEVLEGGRAGVYVVTVDTNTRDTSFKAGRPVR